MDLHGYEEKATDPRLKGVYTWKAATHGEVLHLYHYYPWWFYVLRKIRKVFWK